MGAPLHEPLGVPVPCVGGPSALAAQGVAYDGVADDLDASEELCLVAEPQAATARRQLGATGARRRDDRRAEPERFDALPWENGPRCKVDRHPGMGHEAPEVGTCVHRDLTHEGPRVPR